MLYIFPGTTASLIDKFVKSRAEELYNNLPDDLKKDLEFVVNSAYSAGEKNGKRNSRIVTGKIGNWSECN